MFLHDLWNRLVKVEYTPDGGSPSTRAEYEYNGLTWRIVKRSDTYPANGSLDQERTMYYSAMSSWGGWQLLEERIDEDYIGSSGINRHMQYVWGPRYIDDIVLRRHNSDLTNDGSGITYEDVWHHLTDAQFSTVAILNSNATVAERVSYIDAYGTARHHPEATYL